MLSFAAAVFFLTATPGPGVLSAAGVGSGFGYSAGIRYIVGLFVGTNLVAVAAASGIAAVVLADERARLVLTFVSVAYLVYLAARIAFAGTKVAFIESRKAPAIGNGILLQVVNPKAYAVNIAFFSGFGFAPSHLGFEIAAKFLIINAVWIPVHLAWLSAGVLLRRLDLSQRAQTAINVAMALSMLFAVALAVSAVDI